MKAEELKISKVLIEGNNFYIPSYQRPYKWDGDNVTQLVNDIYQSFLSGDKEYFIGSIVCVDKGNDLYEVVDGQQRLTTLVLILAKVKDLIDASTLKDNLQRRILPINPYTNKAEEPRLKIRKQEEDLYVNYILQCKENFLPKYPTETDLKFINNFKEIGVFLEENIKSIDGYKKLIQYILDNVFIVFIKTNSFASSYRLFSVLNTRGMSLQKSDLVKNKLLDLADNPKDNDSTKSKEKIEFSWNKIEENVGVNDMDIFLTMYEISKKTNKNRGVPKDELEDLLFKRGLEKEFKNNLIEFVKDLEKTSTYYRKVKDGDFLSNQINRMCLLLTTHLAEWEFLPVALSYLNKYGEDDNFLKFIILFEKIYLHHWFSDENKGGRESFCYHTISNMNNKASFFELKNAMIEVSKNDYFDFFNKNIYLKSNRLTKYVLLRIDQEMQDSSVSKQYSGKITIEHILPQQMKDSYWTSRFSVNDHGQWVHKLGNLTLISGQKNSAASNGSFDKKRTVYEGQGKKVSFDIAKDVFQYKEWNLDNLKKRHQFLLDKAKEIWFVDKNKQLSI